MCIFQFQHFFPESFPPFFKMNPRIPAPPSSRDSDEHPGLRANHREGGRLAAGPRPGACPFKRFVWGGTGGYLPPIHRGFFLSRVLIFIPKEPNSSLKKIVQGASLGFSLSYHIIQKRQHFLYVFYVFTPGFLLSPLLNTTSSSIFYLLCCEGLIIEFFTLSQFQFIS